MTVVNAMRFNDTEGGMVADSQGSKTVRKYTIVEKLRCFTTDNGTSLLAGGSGVLELLLQVQDQLNAALKGNSLSVAEIAECTSTLMTTLKRHYIECHLRSAYGISFEQALSGHNIGSHLFEPIKQLLAGTRDDLQEFFSNAFLLLGRDTCGLQLYTVSMTTGAPVPSALPYACIGSGADASDHILGQHLSRLRKDKRSHLSLVEGMTLLLRATNIATDFNSGVGGVPTVAYFRHGESITLGEDESRFASEVVRLQDAQLLTQKASSQTLDQLLHGTTSLQELEHRTFRKARNYDALMRCLRGYK